ncbi:MBL fold metallo-hydrolase [Aquabacterium sp.]|uniref:MBL fold metallo-hydrolase n=1 Tax=Aquabacterium sp. TaxID=1872578 RepID=UPI002C3B5660|nr:MBL fold metallo-hydrolase [Aquabacterium sp.]HSW08241.1 MBL fold metallo-hydrolase [Aquabacterium sp.]
MAGALQAEEIGVALRRVGAQLLVRGWLSANSVVFREHGHKSALVVDTGYVSHVEQTVSLVRQAIGARTLGAIVNTHLHSDHCGGNAGLQREWPAATIAVPCGYLAALMPWDESRLSYRHTGQRCETFVPDTFLAPNTEVQLGGSSWEVHAAPGHDPDAVLLFEPQEGVLISGDALWENRLAIIFPELAGDSGFDATHHALDLIERLQPRLVLPGHGGAFSDVASALAQSRARLNAFVKSPDRHRKHAVRALVVYHMLEVQQQSHAELAAWITGTPIFGATLGCAHDPDLANQLATETVGSLISDGVLSASADHIRLAIRD